MSQKLCQIVFKIVLYIYTYVCGYVMLLEWHVNNDKLCFIINMDVKKYKLNHWIFQF